MDILTAALSEQGGRARNDDTVLIQQRGGGTYLFVGDGLGAYAGGAQASRAAAKRMMEDAGRMSMLSEAALGSAAQGAHEAVLRLQRKTGGSMKTTMVFLALERDTARWMHVGDSRLYHFRAGRLAGQTRDHSVSQMAVLMGQIAQEQIRLHEDRSRVLRALGAANAKPELSGPVRLQTSDAFLLCTDGFWEYVYETEMEALLGRAKTPREWLARMEEVLLTRAPEDTDNYSAAAVFCK